MVKQAILDPVLENTVRSLVGDCGEIYLVGGAIRDHQLRIKSKDVDFVVKRNAIPAARAVADRLHGKYYTLDKQRETGRVLVDLAGEPLVIDFATMSGGNIVSDLHSRDFTINAIAMNVNDPAALIDPLKGEQDLGNGILKPCNPESFAQDPVRVIRAVRFMQTLGLKPDGHSKELLIAAAPLLQEVSAERKRDELFHVFEAGGIKASCGLLREFGIWNEVFPNIERLETAQRFPPHVHDLLEHTLQVLNYCEFFFQVLEKGSSRSESKYLRSGGELLLEFRDALLEFLAHPIHAQRSTAGLLYLAVLYHDIGKTLLLTSSDGDSRCVENHAEISADFFHRIEPQWALSKDENLFIERVIRCHSLQNVTDDSVEVDPGVRIYRFFKQSNSAGVLLAIFHLADILAAYEDTITEARWERALNTSRILLRSWFNGYAEVIDPPLIVDGDGIMTAFNLQPGRIVGEILEEIREAQVSGKVKTRKEALNLAGMSLSGRRME